ncbi:acyl-CoA dehydrogenase, N-terminal domain protein [Mycobacterium ulcerans str. Harvey]|uniref:Acyl-CoA dehydrogenase, N-terminal domain protein n=1 Tax=Mycobacterium ulcerans str. Harvey TaxID=1299332 RepID=A0ABP3A7A2_MYCUL|nr:acyl-CoA dehydrogenase, N-terminal domain protein [Mycobacterium ulcerans str. Harvey]
MSFDPKWWRRAAELGWTSLLIPEQLGGGSVSGNAVVDLAMVAEELGKTVAPGPLHPVSTVLAALVDCAQRDAHVDLIESLMSGEAVASWAVSEPGRGWDPVRAPALLISRLVSWVDDLWCRAIGAGV